MKQITVSIRSAETSDAVGLARVQIETWRDAYVGMLPDEALIDLDEMRAAVRWTRLVAHLEEPDRLSVAVVDGDVVGFCHGGSGRRAVSAALGAADRMAEIYALYVDPSFQSLGIGRALLGHVAQGLESDGFTALTILTLESNRHGRRFYETLGGAAGEAVPSVITGAPIDQTPYVWSDLSVLVRRIETAQG
ncbi:GNAT family N-acetyltransferase [Thalassobaculum sp. OXR-137]|uniref:GNAT family N-acetyltransferase n=1 Tax=Thalassobaculum sp. OXR-137 TaxID=3100173 RepID=UPI002AC8FA1E|nr:GNAT family N-acetyltransferase [Thalassobaculum sp. OXR-137]WPZ33697.1 GNAT family N-acetyltransferase [Thalassobaculum sp. OXR-137]